jgi:hypothetical protein
MAFASSSESVPMLMNFTTSNLVQQSADHSSKEGMFGPTSLRHATHFMTTKSGMKVSEVPSDGTTDKNNTDSAKDEARCQENQDFISEKTSSSSATQKSGISENWASLT